MWPPSTTRATRDRNPVFVVSTRMDDLDSERLDLVLARRLGRCIESCEQALKTYRAREAEPFVDGLMLAIGAMQAAIRMQTYDRELRQASLRIAAMLARKGAATVRRYGLDDELLNCADACERAAFICEDVLLRAA